MMRTKFLFGFFLLFTAPVAVIAQQDRAAMEKERQELQKEIKEIQGAYNKAKGETKQELNQLTLLKTKINLQERYIGNLNKEVKIIDDELYLSNIEIYRLTKQLDTLKEQYAKTIVYAYKHRGNYEYLNFIFSSANFNDAVRRVAYLKSYREYRAKQVSNILEHQQLIAKRQQQQQGRKAQKVQVLDVQTSERNELATQKKEKDQVVTKLKSKEKDLQKQIAARQKKQRDLMKAINAVILRENAKIEAEAKARRLAGAKRVQAEKDAAASTAKNATTPKTTTPKTTTPTTSVTPKATPPKQQAEYEKFDATDIALNADFAKNKGRLPWPVDNGTVTQNYGPSKHTEDGLELVDEFNYGIWIATPVGSSVKAIFEGEVAAVFNLDGNMNVIIRHGKYVTTYSNLRSASVSKGQKISRGQSIGAAAENEDGSGGAINFLLLVNGAHTNPKPWLRP